MSDRAGTSDGPARPLELDPERATRPERAHYAVVDIGSNSVRLVVYDQLGRAPFPRFNEKSLCRLGEGLDRLGRALAGRVPPHGRGHPPFPRHRGRHGRGPDRRHRDRGDPPRQQRRAARGRHPGAVGPRGPHPERDRGGALRLARRHRRLLPAAGPRRRHGRRQPRGRRDPGRPGRRALGQPAAGRPAGAIHAGRGQARGEAARRPAAQGQPAAGAHRAGVLRRRRRLAGASPGPTWRRPTPPCGSRTATRSAPRTRASSPSSSGACRRPRSPSCRASRPAAPRRCRRRPWSSTGC